MNKTCCENREDVELLLADFRMLIADCNDISRPKTYLKKKNSLCLSTKKLHAGDIWAQFWGEKSVGNAPVNMVAIIKESLVFESLKFFCSVFTGM